MNVEQLLRHNVQPMIVQQIDEDEDTGEQEVSADPDRLFRRQLRKIRRGEAVAQLVLRVR